MTVSSRPRLVARIGSIALVIALAGLASSGCEDKHIGRRCDLALADDGGAAAGQETATINSQAVECPSRICLQAAQANGPVNTGPLCTAECGGDDDCADGQTGAAPLCQGGFKCVIPTTVGDFCCKRMCVCKDFLVASMPFQVPPVCMSGMGSTCKNVH
jgi:hypothetical protein